MLGKADQKMLKAEDISIGYGKREILRNITFSLSEGEIVAVLGANGAGKTTLLRALNNTLKPSAGIIFLDGNPIGDYSRREIASRIAVDAQENETKFPVTVLEFVLSGRFAHGNVFGWESERDLETAIDSLKICDLTDYRDRLLNELSGGERQRVLLARAIATEAGLLLLDEPTNNLDLSHQALMLGLVRKRSETYGSSAVIITHDLNLASEFADKIMLLKNGGILAQGEPEKVLTDENILRTFGVEVVLDRNPVTENVRVTTIFGK